MPETSKAFIRERARAARRGLPPAQRSALSRAACERVLALPAVASLTAGSVVLAYVASAEELDPAPALDALRERGVRVAYPRVTGPSALTLHECGVDELEPGAFGISQPCETAAAVAADEIALVVVPGVAFDASGHRLGYGGGYYDRLLGSMRGVTFVGVAFDGQLVETLPAEEHDVAMDWVITPTRTIHARR